MKQASKSDTIGMHFKAEVPAAYVPRPDVRAWRAMIEHRHTLIAERTRVKNRLRALLRTNGIATPRGLWTRRGIAWLAEVTFEGALSHHYAGHRNGTACLP